MTASDQKKLEKYLSLILLVSSLYLFLTSVALFANAYGPLKVFQFKSFIQFFNASIAYTFGYNTKPAFFMDNQSLNYTIEKAFFVICTCSFLLFSFLRGKVILEDYVKNSEQRFVITFFLFFTLLLTFVSFIVVMF